jgi:hypothetical protein
VQWLIDPAGAISGRPARACRRRRKGPQLASAAVRVAEISGGSTGSAGLAPQRLGRAGTGTGLGPDPCGPRRCRPSPGCSA